MGTHRFVKTVTQKNKTKKTRDCIRIPRCIQRSSRRGLHAAPQSHCRSEIGKHGDGLCKQHPRQSGYDRKGRFPAPPVLPFGHRGNSFAHGKSPPIVDFSRTRELFHEKHPTLSFATRQAARDLFHETGNGPESGVFENNSQPLT